MLEVGAVEGDVVGDAVDDDGVGSGLVHVRRAGLDELGVDAVEGARVDVLDERAGKAVFHAEQNADLLHAVSLLMSRKPPWFENSLRHHLRWG